MPTIDTHPTIDKTKLNDAKARTLAKLKLGTQSPSAKAIDTFIKFLDG